jgi:hypothetical protein
LRIWDGIRAIDYVSSRPEVNPQLIGYMGQSGGGTMTSLMQAVEPRIKVAAPSCYLTSLSELCHWLGPQDAEQNVFGQLTFGLTHAGYALLGDNAVRIHSCHADFFPIAGSRRSAALLATVAKNCGLDPDRYGITDVPGPHGWKESLRASSIQLMRRYLAGDTSTPPIDVSACRALDKGFSTAAVDCGLGRDADKRKKPLDWVTPGGRVSKLPGFKSIYAYLADDVAAAKALGGTRFVEFGPGKVLSGLIKKIDPALETLNVGDIPSLEATLSAMG